MERKQMGKPVKKSVASLRCVGDASVDGETAGATGRTRQRHGRNKTTSLRLLLSRWRDFFRGACWLMLRSGWSSVIIGFDKEAWTRFCFVRFGGSVSLRCEAPRLPGQCGEISARGQPHPTLHRNTTSTSFGFRTPSITSRLPMSHIQGYLGFSKMTESPGEPRGNCSRHSCTGPGPITNSA